MSETPALMPVPGADIPEDILRSALLRFGRFAAKRPASMRDLVATQAEIRRTCLPRRERYNRVMSLSPQEREVVHEYCRRDLGGDMNWHIDQFPLIMEIELRRRLGRAFYSARYIYKLMEALSVSGDELHAFVKFQVVQYASIYEAVISHLLWGHFKDHSEVLEMETHKIYKKVSGLSKDTAMKYGDEDLYTCIYATAKKQRNSIAFPDKVDCAVRVGFVQSTYAEEIKQLYTLRTLAHIETEAENRSKWKSRTQRTPIGA